MLSGKEKIFKKHCFTLIELLIAVLILVIVSAVVLGVFRQTLKNYKKGMAYSEISAALGGSFMIMESDLTRMVPLGDKETVYFKKNEFSFVAVSHTVEGKSYLEQVRYRIGYDNTLKRAVVKFPGERRDIDSREVVLLSDIDEMYFRYIFPKKDDDKKQGSDKTKSSDKGKETSSTTKKSKYVSSSEDTKDDAGKSSETAKGSSNDKDKKKTIKRPIVVGMKGCLKQGNIEQYFMTSFSAAYQKDLGTSTDTDTKSNSQDSSQSNPTSESQQ